MKKLKKVVIGLVAVATACSMLTFSACSDSDSGAESEITSAADTTKELTYKSAKISADVGVEEKYSYSYGADTSYERSDSASMNATMLLDFESMNYDMYTTESYDSGSYLYYEFYRDGFVFEFEDEGESSDIATASDITTGTTLKTYYDSYGTSDSDSILGIILDEDYMPTFLTMPFAVASLADKYDAASIDSSAITVNVGKLVSSLYSDFINVINSINEDTTVADLLGYDLVKNLIDSVSVGMDASEIYDFVISILEDNLESRVVSAIKLAIKPAEGTSLYDFICSLAEDEDLYSVVMDAEGSFGAIKAVELIEQVYGESLEVIQESFTDITVSYSDNVAVLTYDYKYEEESLSYYDYEVISISGDLIYNLNSDGSLKSLSVDCEFSLSSDWSETYRGVDYSSSTDITYDIEATIELSTSAASLKDISSNPVSVRNSSATFDNVGEYLATITAIEEDDSLLADYYSNSTDRLIKDDESEINKELSAYLYLSLEVDKLSQTGTYYIIFNYEYYCYYILDEEQIEVGLGNAGFGTYGQFSYTIEGNKVTFSFDTGEEYLYNEYIDVGYNISTVTVELDENGEFELTVKFEITIWYDDYDASSDKFNSVEETIPLEITIHLYV